jgi:hypothetical protein
MFEKTKKRRGLGPIVIVTMVVVTRVIMNVDGNDQGSIIGQQ